MKWEYKVVEISKRKFFSGKVDNAEFERELNEYGSQGWELILISDNVLSGWGGLQVTLKRQK